MDTHETTTTTTRPFSLSRIGLFASSLRFSFVSSDAMRRFGGERGGGERRFRACALRKRMRRRDFCLLGGETKKRCLPKVQLLFRVSLVVFFFPFFGSFFLREERGGLFFPQKSFETLLLSRALLHFSTPPW